MTFSLVLYSVYTHGLPLKVDLRHSIFFSYKEPGLTGQEGIVSPRTGAMDGCQLTHGCWVLPRTMPSLQPAKCFGKENSYTNVKRYMRLDVHADCNSLILVRNFVLRALYRSLDGSAIGMLADLHGLSSVPSTRIWWVTLLVIQAP